MPRIAIELPDHFSFTTTLPVRITDLNYGGHVGNDVILSLIHEARLQFLQSFGYTEKDLGGTGMIMGDVAIVFRNELFYGDELVASVAVNNLSRATFDLFYRLQKRKDGELIEVAHAKTGMVCFDYEKRKAASLPQEVRALWTGGEKDISAIP